MKVKKIKKSTITSPYSERLTLEEWLQEVWTKLDDFDGGIDDFKIEPVLTKSKNTITKKWKFTILMNTGIEFTDTLQVDMPEYTDADVSQYLREHVSAGEHMSIGYDPSTDHYTFNADISGTGVDIVLEAENGVITTDHVWDRFHDFFVEHNKVPSVVINDKRTEGTATYYEKYMFSFGEKAGNLETRHFEAYQYDLDRGYGGSYHYSLRFEVRRDSRGPEYDQVTLSTRDYGYQTELEPLDDSIVIQQGYKIKAQVPEAQIEAKIVELLPEQLQVTGMLTKAVDPETGILTINTRQDKLIYELAKGGVGKLNVVTMNTDGTKSTAVLDLLSEGIDYETKVNNKPSINGVTLDTGDWSSEELGLQEALGERLPSFYSTADKLATQEWTREQIAMMGGTFIGNFETKADLPETPVQGDMAVVNKDESHDDQTWMYIYQNGSWTAMYEITGGIEFTTDQWAAINSGITASMVTYVTNHIQNGRIHVPGFHDEDIDHVLAVGDDHALYWKELEAELPDYTEAQGKALKVNDDGDLVWEAINELPAVGGALDGQVLMIDDGEAVWATLDKELPSYDATYHDCFLKVAATGDLVWEELESELPEYDRDDAGKALFVAADGTLVFASISHPKELPSFTAEQAGKVLGVKSDGTLDWASIEKELPQITSTDKGKVLRVDQSGNLVWDDETQELPDFTSAEEGKVLGVVQGALAWTDKGGGGGSVDLYQHTLNVFMEHIDGNDEFYGDFTITIINDSSTPLGLDGLFMYLDANARSMDDNFKVYDHPSGMVQYVNEHDGINKRGASHVYWIKQTDDEEVVIFEQLQMEMPFEQTDKGVYEHHLKVQPIGTSSDGTWEENYDANHRGVNLTLIDNDEAPITSLDVLITRLHNKYPGASANNKVALNFSVEMYCTSHTNLDGVFSTLYFDGSNLSLGTGFTFEDAAGPLTLTSATTIADFVTKLHDHFDMDVGTAIFDPVDDVTLINEAITKIGSSEIKKHQKVLNNKLRPIDIKKLGGKKHG